MRRAPKACGMLGPVLLVGLLASQASSSESPRWNESRPWAKPSRPEPLPWMSVGVFASHAHYEFPRTNELLGAIVARVVQEYPGHTQLGRLETDLGLLSYLQVRIRKGLSFRLSVHYSADRTTTMEPEGYGPVRADVRARASPVNLAYSLVQEIRAGRTLLAIGAGVDQYRWTVRWRFYETGEEPLEDWEWRGRGRGGRGFLEMATGGYGLKFRFGVSYHCGSFDMDTDPPVSSELGITPSHFEEDVDHFQYYAGLTFDMF